MNHTKTNTINEDNLEIRNESNVDTHNPSHKKALRFKKRFSIKIILSSFVLLLIIVGSAAGFYLTQFSNLDLRQQAYVGQSCTGSGNSTCSNADEECKLGKCVKKPIVQPKDCSFAEHNEYACESLVKCVQCVDGQSTPATRADCAAQNPNALCKPSTNTAGCGWADHGEYACKTSNECVQCLDGAMTNSTSPSCPTPCGAGVVPPSPGGTCSEVSQKECTKSGKSGIQSCTFTKRSNTSPFECTLNPTACGVCNVPLNPPAEDCGAENETCCTSGNACNTGFSCKNNKCSKTVATSKFSCIDGECKSDPDGTYYTSASCDANCAPETEVEPGAVCSERKTKSCSTNGQIGTQTCTFTRIGDVSPFLCSQTPTNCTTCVVPNPSQCTYSTDSSQNEKQCFVGNSIRVCNDTNMWSMGTCKFDCQGSSCCGGNGETCCAGSNPCSSDLTCGTENTCRVLGPILDEPVTPTDTIPEPIVLNLAGASCDGASTQEVCGDNMVTLCQYTKRSNQSPYECNQGKVCGSCTPLPASEPEPTTDQSSGCNPSTSSPSCLGTNTVLSCLPNSDGQSGSWYEVDCPTACAPSTGICASAYEYSLSYQLYQKSVNNILSNTVEDIINSTSILDLTGTL